MDLLITKNRLNDLFNRINNTYYNTYKTFEYNNFPFLQTVNELFITKKRKKSFYFIILI